MVKNSIKVYARVKYSSDQSQTEKYDIDSKRDYQEITFGPNSHGDCRLYRNSKLKYRFCSIFDQYSRQNDVFDKLARPVVNSVLQGYNGTIFAYGQTGSGKTYSITGSAEYENRGLIPRTIQYIFNYIQKNTNALYNIYISYLEIYNEVCYDLLNPKHRATILEELPRVTLLEDSKGRTHLKNLSVISVASEREARCLMFLGDTNRTIAETPMNLYSSRSHCIFTIHVAATMATDGRVRRSKLHLVDLAGSERVQKSGISGIQLVDAKQINLSLHYLEQVIIALSDAKRVHVPYRNSVMTTVLRDSLGGNCLTAMLATFSIEPRNFEETISTCKFAQRVALVNTEAIINEEEDPNLEISKLKIEVEKLKTKLAFYEEQNPFENLLENKTEISSARMKEYESHIFSYLKDPSDEFPLVKDLGTIQIYFQVFKKIFKSCQNFTKEKDSPISNSKNTKKFDEIIKRKNNEISILIKLLDREKSMSNSKCMPHANIVQNNMPNTQYGLADQEEFEKFLNDSTNKSEINYYINAMQQKFKIAESIATRIKMCKQNIVNIKKRMQHPDLSTKLKCKILKTRLII
ncbi:Kinesin-like protein at 64D [Carabus blaptoides fortunei]